MSQKELELECSKWKIGAYADARGNFRRELAIPQLLARVNANNSIYATLISILALIISLVSLFY